MAEPSILEGGDDSDPVAVFRAQLQQLRAECGSPSIRDLERLSVKVGRPQSRSVIQAKLTGRTTPDWAFVEMLVEACVLHAGNGRDPQLREIIVAADRLSDERYAEVVISTAHKAKGREWSTVKIGNDFRQPAAGENGAPGRVPRGEAMLAYVAVTRAKQTLDRGGLAWIDDQLAGVASARPGSRRRGNMFDDDTRAVFLSQDY